MVGGTVAHVRNPSDRGRVATMADNSERADQSGTPGAVGKAERGEAGGDGGGIAPFGLPAGSDSPRSEEAADIGRELIGGGTTGDLTGGTSGGGTVRSGANGDLTGDLAGGSIDGGATGEGGGLGRDAASTDGTTRASPGGPAQSEMGGAT